LFGGTAFSQELRFEQEYHISLKDKLMMEFEVFKTFVSLHPFDGLYQYAKKFTLISQFKDVENY